MRFSPARVVIAERRMWNMTLGQAYQYCSQGATRKDEEACVRLMNVIMAILTRERCSQRVTGMAMANLTRVIVQKHMELNENPDGKNSDHGLVSG